VTVVVRPEHALLTTDEAAASLTGTVENIVYFGTDTRYHLRLADGAEFVIRAQSRRGGETGPQWASPPGRSSATPSPRSSRTDGRAARACRNRRKWKRRVPARRGARRGAPPLAHGVPGAGHPDVRRPRAAAIMVVYSFLTPAGLWRRGVAVLHRGLVPGAVRARHLRRHGVGGRRASVDLLALGQDLAGTTVLALAFGFPTAYFIATRPERSRGVWLFLVTIPFWTNLLIRTFAIQEVIRNEGIINTMLLIWIGVIETPIQMLYTDFAIMLGMLYVYLPLMVLPLYASMEKLDFRMVEAGYDLYASRLQVLRRIILPLVRPGIIAGSILVFIPSLGAYVTPRVLGGGKQHDDRQPDRAAVRPGAQLAARRGAVDDLLTIVMVALLFYIRAVSRPEPHHG
jgi:ABC-type molybdate transport system permease subunit